MKQSTSVVGISFLVALVGCAAAESEERGTAGDVDVQEEESAELAVSLYGCSITPVVPQVGVVKCGARGEGDFSCGSSPYTRRTSVWLTRNTVDRPQTDNVVTRSAGGYGTTLSFCDSYSGGYWRSAVQILAYDNGYQIGHSTVGISGYKYW